MLKPRLDSVQAASLAPEKSDATVAMDHSEAWQRVCRRLRAEVGEDVFNSWFGRLELDEVQDDIARLSVPTKFLKSWIQSHYHERILGILASEHSEINGLAIDVRTSSRRPVTSKAELPQSASAPRAQVPRRAASGWTPGPGRRLGRVDPAKVKGK